MAQLASPPVRVLLWSLINAESPPEVTCSDGPRRNSIEQRRAVDAPDFAAALEDSESEPLLRRHCVANPMGFEVLDDGVHYHALVQARPRLLAILPPEGAEDDLATCNQGLAAPCPHIGHVSRS